MTGSPWRARLAVGLVVAVVVSPLVVGGLSLIGDTWRPVNDWSHMVYRVSRVGTRETPLIGPYSVHGWAHPGPLVFWLGAPLYRLTGGDPRSLLWTATILNCVTVAALGAVAWRRGRWPLLAATMALAALLVHGLGAEILNDLWNPFIPLLPFLLTVFLVWDAALGRHRALLEAILPASLAAQSHLAFVPLVVLVLAWFAAWTWLRPRILPDASDGPDLEPLSPRAVRLGVLAVVALWIGPLLDLVFDRHNPARIAWSLVSEARPQIGPVDATGVVGRYVRPDGPWSGGPEPVSWGSIVGSGPFPLLVALALLVGCFAVARRRGFTDVAALASLSLVLVVGAVPATSRVVLPSVPYLTEWLSVVGALVWFTVGWTLWRLAPRRPVGLGVAAVAIVGATTFAWAPASRWLPARSDLLPVVDDLRADLAATLPKDRRYRVELRGDRGNNLPGLVYWMIEDGYDLVAHDGAAGLKWGHEHAYDGDREDYDTLIVIAAHMPGTFVDSYAPCAAEPGNELVADYDGLTRGERAWLEDYNLRAFADPDGITAAERRRAERIEQDNLRIGVFVAERICGTPPRPPRS